MHKSVRAFGEAVAGVTYVSRPGGKDPAASKLPRHRRPNRGGSRILPGGGQDDGETPEHAAVREAYEECGLRIRVRSRVVTADELVYAEDEGTYYRKRCAFFSADIVRRESQGETENDLLWISPEEAAARLRHESQRWAVSQACGPKPAQ